MTTEPLKGILFILISGILNCLLGIIHQIVLYFEYSRYSATRTPETAQVIADYLLFSMATGTVIFFIGLLLCYCYTGIKRRETWAAVISAGASVLLCLFAVKLIVIIGLNHPIAYVHLFNSLMIVVPLMVNRKSFKNLNFPIKWIKPFTALSD